MDILTLEDRTLRSIRRQRIFKILNLSSSVAQHGYKAKWREGRIVPQEIVMMIHEVP